MILNSLININIFSNLLRMILGSPQSVCRRHKQAMSSDLYVNSGPKSEKKWLCGDFSQFITKSNLSWLRRGKMKLLAVSLIRLDVPNYLQWVGITFEQLDQAAALKTIWHTSWVRMKTMRHGRKSLVSQFMTLPKKYKLFFLYKWFTGFQ